VYLLTKTEKKKHLLLTELLSDTVFPGKRTFYATVSKSVTFVALVRKAAGDVKIAKYKI
jgi:hypothetical protein